MEAPKPKAKQKPTPSVKDQFWFDMSAKVINESISNLDKGLSKLDTYITALWVIYTAASIFSIKYIKLKEDDFYWFIVTPHLLLLLGRCFIVLSQMPVRMDLVVNSADLIKDAYGRVFGRKRLSLFIGSVLALLATISVIVTLTYSFQKNNELRNFEYQKANKVKPSLSVDYSKEKEKLLFTAEISPKTTCDIKVIIVSKEKDTVLNKQLELISTEEGLIRGEFSIPPNKYGRIETQTQWTDTKEKIKKSLMRIVMNPEPKTE